MKKKINVFRIFLLAMLSTGILEMNVEAFSERVKDTMYVKQETELTEDEIAKSPLFTTKYIVSVKRAKIRSGPGTSYPVQMTLYQDDVIWVRSISNGWAKFKVNGIYYYVSVNSIKKAT